jgi:hypothetical protein
VDFGAVHRALMGVDKRDSRNRGRALRAEPLGLGLDGLVRAVFAGRSVRLLEIAVSEENALRRVREEIAELETERVRLSTDVMEGRLGALEEDERLRQRMTELGRWLLEAENQSGEAGAE